MMKADSRATTLSMSRATRRGRGKALLLPQQLVTSPETHIRYRIDSLLGQGGFGQAYLAKRMTPSRTIPSVIAIKASEHIDGWLREQEYRPPVAPELITFEMLNTWYYADAPRTVQPELEAARRSSTFDEVVGGLDESNALFEARRCLSCGNCFSCDNCYGVCPDNAVLKLSDAADANVNGYEIDLDYCKGCGICVAECPCGAIEMVPEKI